MKARFLLAGLFLLGGAVCRAQSPDATLFKVQADRMVSADVVPVRFETSGEIPLASTNPVYGLSVSGHVALKHETNSMVRITAECADGIEYLVYEANPLLEEEKEFDITDAAWETAVLQAEKLTKLNVTLLNATFTLQSVKYASSAPKNALARQNLQKAQENALIDRLNESLEKKGMLWRAGNTSVSELTYEQKKAMFGDSVPYLGGFEYYRGGIFVMPGYDPEAARKVKSAEDDKYVKEWDWRNRHGKNWMTSVKNQGECNSCVLFAMLGTIEAYANLYYNRKIDLDLSEQEFLCNSVIPICRHGSYLDIFADMIYKNGGVMEESCFPYEEDTSSCSHCGNPTENINIENINVFDTIDNQEDVKKMLLRAPVALLSEMSNHAIVIVGYKKLEEGDEVRFPNKRTDHHWEYEYINPGSALIGSTAWLIKNSWGDWGLDGYCLMVEDISKCQKAEMKGKVYSIQYTDNDIVVEDADGDGYYFWGVGARPSGLPDWIPLKADGDDADNRKGPIDDYGNLKDIVPTTMRKDIHISKNTNWTSLKYCLPDVYMEAGATLTITGEICLNRYGHIFVKDGGSLILNNAKIEQASIKVYSGGHMEIKNGSVLNRAGDDTLEVDKGATMKWTNGAIKKK